MTRFTEKSFSVPMPGEAAKQWPKCEARHEYGITCEREFGHKQKHRATLWLDELAMNVEWE